MSLGLAKLDKDHREGTSPYEESVKADFIKKYNTAILKAKRVKKRKMTEDEFVQFNKRFALRYDKQFRTRFAETVVLKYEGDNMVAFDFEGKGPMVL